MKYEARSFDSIYYLKDFLNANKISQKNIVGIFRKDSGFVELLYIEPQAASEEQVMLRRTKGEQKAYLAGYERCADCIQEYLTDEGKQKLKCLLIAVRNAAEIEDVEPKTGHWITTRTFMHDGEYYCDQCKCDSPNNEKWDYCPNCGAKMIESQERIDQE